MEKKKRAAVALENELELGAVAEAQVAQAEGLLLVVEAIHRAQAAFTKYICWATGLGVAAAIIGICSFLYWQTQNVREAANLALPSMQAAHKSSAPKRPLRERDRGLSHRIRESHLVQRMNRNSTKPFVEWHPADAEAAVESAMSDPDGSLTRLEWITSQHNWATILCLDTVVKIQKKL